MATTATSLPSLFMTYLTGSGSTNNKTATTNLDASPDPAVDRQLYPEPASTPLNNRPRPALQHTPQSGRSSTLGPSPSKSVPSILYGEEHMSCASDDVSRDGLSREGSFIGSNHGRGKKRSKSKTSYSICQPPPKPSARSKLHVRARPLLQLHRLAASSRPMPAFELLPTAIFSPSLSRAIAKVFHTRHHLRPTDLAIVKADQYHQHEDAVANVTAEDESHDVLALICKSRKTDSLGPGTAKIFLDDGTEWEAHGLPNGGYEFSTTDEHGLTTKARWVLKRPRARRSQSAAELGSPQSVDPPSRKFNFSTISPSSRRHPVIANLTSTTLDIQDYYNIPAPAPSILSPDAASSPLAEDDVRGEPVETTANLRTLITASAVWVALREGWSPGYKHEDLLMRSPSTKISGSPVRTVPEPSDAAKDVGPRRSGSVARMLRSASGLKRRSTASGKTDGSSDDAGMSRSSSIHSATAPKTRPRAESASTVIIHRTTWPRPEMRAMRKHTGASTATHIFGRDNAEDMTEEEEGDLEENAVTATPTKRMSAPARVVLAPSSSSDEDGESKTPLPAKTFVTSNSRQKKRESSSTDTSMEAKKSPANTPVKRKRRIFKSLLCGMV